MKRVKRIAVVVLSLSLIIVFAGCGCQNNSNENNSNNTTQETNSSNSSQSDDSNASTKTANSDFEPTISLEQRKAVKAEDYINGNKFDLDGYAKALGYTKLDDPKGATVYAIKRDGVKCLFTFADGEIIAWFDYNDGYFYQADPVGIAEESNGYIINTGSNEGQQIAVKSGLDGIIEVLSYISSAYNMDLRYLPTFSFIFKVKGSPVYYPNGVVKEMGRDVVETIYLKQYSRK